MDTQLSKLYLSQSALNTFNACPVGFKRKYLEGISWNLSSSINSKEDESRELGRLFHVIAERYFNGIPTGIEEGVGDMYHWFEALKRFIPRENGLEYYPEYELRLNRGNVKLQAKYDLILRENDKQYTIFDWKTEAKPLSANKAAISLQTVLYRYLLVEAGSRVFQEQILPQNVKMIYWQPTRQSTPVVLPYSEDQFIQDGWLLTNLVNKVLSYDFEKAKEIESDQCGRCQFRILCIQ